MSSIKLPGACSAQPPGTLHPYRATPHGAIAGGSSEHAYGAGLFHAAAMDSPPGMAAADAPSTALGGTATMAGVFFVFIMLALALVFLQYYFNDGVRAAPRDSERRPLARGSETAGAGARSKGVDPELLRSLPVTVYRAAAKGSREEEAVECAVCLAELEDGEEARFLPRCGHGFHAECVDMWLAYHATCPLCRLTVAKPDASPATLPPLPPEPANYAANLPASVLLEVSSQGATTSVTVTTSDGDPSSSAPAADVLVIEIPEPTPVATPRDPAKSPGLARLRSLRRMWSFGRQGPSGSTPSSYACGRSGEGADVEQGISAAVGIRAVETPPLTPAAASRATPRLAAVV